MKFSYFFKAQKYISSLIVKNALLLGISNIIIQAINSFYPLLLAVLYKNLMSSMEKSYINMTLEKELLSALIIYLIVSLLSHITRNWSGIISTRFSDKINLSLNNLLTNSLYFRNFGYFDNPNNKDAIEKIQMYKSVVGNNIGTSITILIKLVSFIVSLILFIPYNPLLGVIYILTFVPGSIVQFKTSSKMNQYSISSIHENRQKDYYRSVLTESTYAKELRFYETADFFKGLFFTSWKSIRNERKRIFKKGTLSLFFATFVSYSGLIALLAWSIYMVYLGKIQFGMFSMYLVLAQNCASSFRELSIMFPLYFKIYAPQICQFQEFLNDQANIEKDGKINKCSAPFLIKFINVCFKYPGSEELVLNKVNFEMNSEDKIAIVGENGAGKSTIVKLLLRLYEPTSGEILINGINIQEYSYKTIRSMFSVCFQEPTGYALSLKDNIAISNMEANNDSTKIISICNQVGLSGVLEKTPKGIDSQMTHLFDSNGYEPSGGEWQKIMLARVIYSNALISILDEPISSIDSIAEDTLFKQCEKMFEHKGGIIISHRLSFLKLASKIVYIEHGEIKSIGTHKELMSNCSQYARLYNAQANSFSVY